MSVLFNMCGPYLHSDIWELFQRHYCCLFLMEMAILIGEELRCVLVRFKNRSEQLILNMDRTMFSSCCSETFDRDKDNSNNNNNNNNNK